MVRRWSPATVKLPTRHGRVDAPATPAGANPYIHSLSERKVVKTCMLC